MNNRAKNQFYVDKSTLFSLLLRHISHLIDNKYRKMFQQFDFNMMIKQETDDILLIVSDKKDFARYEAVCVFSENKKRKEDEISIVEIYGEYNMGIKGFFSRK